MAVDKLQDKIRKSKCPIVLDMRILPQNIPEAFLREYNSFPSAYKQYCTDLLIGLKDIVPAVRFHFGTMSLFGPEGLSVLTALLDFAHKQGYYVLLEGLQMLDSLHNEFAAQMLWSDDCKFYFDGLILTAYIGSDGIRPYASCLKDSKKDLFVVARTANKSAAELQDLLSGSRLVHIAATELANRYSADLVERCGYSRVGILAAASSPDSLKALRSRFPNMFIILDGSDYPNANAKYCSYAFDKLGHGAVACVGSYITNAWQDEYAPEDYVACAVRAAERMKKNLSRYITIL